jgi:hypothetical protein
MPVKVTVTGIAPKPIEVNSIEEAFGIVQSEEFYRAIGEFIFWFSQLEAHLKARLAGALNLERELFDIIIAPYDFAILCTVLSETLKAGSSPEMQKVIEKHFNKCRGLNKDARVIIAHGSWTLDGARHVDRQKLKANIHFKTPGDIQKATAQAKALMQGITALGVTHR